MSNAAFTIPAIPSQEDFFRSKSQIDDFHALTGLGGATVVRPGVTRYSCSERAGARAGQRVLHRCRHQGGQARHRGAQGPEGRHREYNTVRNAVVREAHS